MKSLALTAAAVITAALSANAQSNDSVPLSKICPYSDVCFQLNIPNNTASTGDGAIYFQVNASTEYEWAALGQGSMMVGSNMFIIYASEDGKNVTLSTRYASERTEPQHDTRASVELLEGTGIKDGYMVANMRCSNCDRWASGYMDFTARQSNWIYAVRKGSALNTDSVTAQLAKHDWASPFGWTLSTAKGGNSSNPFLTQDQVSVVPGYGSPASAFVTENLPNIHGAMATLAFVVLFPIGGILIRLANFRGAIWVHAGLQIIAWIIGIGAIASGVRIAVTLDKFANAHPVIGLVLALLLIGQPIYGFVHHRRYKKVGQRTTISYVHLNIGRILIFGGMINGGLGIALAGNVENSHIVTYAIVAAVLGILYTLAIIWGERRRKRTQLGPQGFRQLGDSTELLNNPRGRGDEQGLAQPQDQELKRLWLQDRQRESMEYTPLAAGEGYADQGHSRQGSRAPSPNGLYDDHQQSIDSRARATMS